MTRAFFSRYCGPLALLRTILGGREILAFYGCGILPVAFLISPVALVFPRLFLSWVRSPIVRLTAAALLRVTLEWSAVIHPIHSTVPEEQSASAEVSASQKEGQSRTRLRWDCYVSVRTGVLAEHRYSSRVQAVSRVGPL